jgi:hypothetical protein
MTEEEKQKERERDRERKRKKREESTATEVSIASPQAIGKAVARVERALPASDATKKLVLQRLYEKYCSPDCPLPSVVQQSTSQTMYSVVVDFFHRDDVSRQAPGRKDYTKNKETKEKVNV